MITVGSLAKKLAISNEETLILLKEKGFPVFDEKSPLNEQEIEKANLNNSRSKNNIEISDNSAEKQAISKLEYYFNNYKIFIDTCSLLHNASSQFWFHATPLIFMTENKIIVPTRVKDELEKHRNNFDNPELQKSAADALENLSSLILGNLVELRGEPTDNFADNVFQVVFTKFRINKKLLLITQDRDLASDILNLNNIKSVKANYVNVRQINQYGYLSSFPYNLNQKPESTSLKKTDSSLSVNVNIRKKIIQEEKFSICTKITNVSDDKLIVASVPNTEESAYILEGEKAIEIKLLEPVASGGEGIIFTTNTPYIAKIYKQEKINKRKHEKLKLMLSKKIDCQGICYPIACLYNKDKQFVGYLMPKATGKELQKSLFIKPLFLKKFPGWKKRDIVELCVTILMKIKYLHDRNIIMGDINPSNILVVSPKEVYFVDTDSYQIEEFPCPVGTINYTAPEIQGKIFNSFIRTKGNENFAVATLLFMIMLPGKPPYSQQGGESPVENIVKMNFSYPFGEQSNKKTPDGPWRFIWSHLTYEIKQSFYETFRIDGERSKEINRLSVDEWIVKYNIYLNLLDTGILREQDVMSEEIFPNRYKKNSNVKYAKCKICNGEFPEEPRNNGYCKDCLKKGDVYKCSGCGKEILYTNYEKYIKKSMRYSVCQECYERSNETYIKEQCNDCGAKFNITYGERDFFTSKGYSLPKRCKNCRGSR